MTASVGIIVLVPFYKDELHASEVMDDAELVEPAAATRSGWTHPDSPLNDVIVNSPDMTAV